MSELISRDAFHVCVACNKQFPDEPCEPSECEIIMALDRLPSIDAAPVVHGHWQEISADDMYGSGSCETAGFICSNCGFDIESNEYDAFNYCPSCGAKMEGE